MENLSQWCFQISRSIFDSEIFKKPAERFKVWIYLIWQVNHADNGLPRGSKYFKYDRICRDCNVSYNQATHIMVFLKGKKQIEVKKATHGCIITLLNYWTYQDIDNYKSKTHATQKQDTRNTGVDNIYKNERIKNEYELRDWMDKEMSGWLNSDTKVNPYILRSIIAMLELWYSFEKKEKRLNDIKESLIERIKLYFTEWDWTPKLVTYEQEVKKRKEHWIENPPKKPLNSLTNWLVPYNLRNNK